MTDGTRDNPDIEEIAAFARGELEDAVRCDRIKNDPDAMELVRQIQTDDDFLTRLAGALVGGTGWQRSRDARIDHGAGISRPRRALQGRAGHRLPSHSGTHEENGGSEGDAWWWRGSREESRRDLPGRSS